MALSAAAHFFMDVFTPGEFQKKCSSGYLSGMIVFGIEGTIERILFTETRVHCGNKKILFQSTGLYKPFSSLIRRDHVEKILKKIIERNYKF